ncbi:hypothetical protein A359_06760 [secondary endosymbiont of Ctenarytaina eucalypti]|uniref:Uncharacterized protein n=1 Tax=secondary endosymbiont of Ctenarytaina eucalypti TaxID=1199245 RepID=J3VSX7_9ENTR|nr:hypothetical protein A359_06760 [secondary endosymbiont of Ctenarytaina eucalypti]
MIIRPCCRSRFKTLCTRSVIIIMKLLPTILQYHLPSGKERHLLLMLSGLFPGSELYPARRFCEN